MSKQESISEQWLRALIQTHREFAESPAYNGHNINAMFSVVLDGLVQDVSADFIAAVEGSGENGPEFRLSIFNDAAGSAYFALATGEEAKGVRLTLKLREVFMMIINDEDIAGLVINPFSDFPFSIERNVLESVAALFMAGYEAGAEETEEEEPDGAEEIHSEGSLCVVECARPCGSKQGEGLIEMLAALDGPEDRLEIRLKNYVGEDEIDRLRINMPEYGVYHVEIDFNMEDFDWDHPLTLGADISFGDTEKIILELCAKGTESDDIELIFNGFRDITEK